MINQTTWVWWLREAFLVPCQLATFWFAYKVVSGVAYRWFLWLDSTNYAEGRWVESRKEVPVCSSK